MSIVTPKCLPEGMKNKLSMASGGDTEVGKEIMHADANVFIVTVSSHRMGGSTRWPRLFAGVRDAGPVRRDDAGQARYCTQIVYEAPLQRVIEAAQRLIEDQNCRLLRQRSER